MLFRSPAALANGIRRAREFVDRDLGPALERAIAAHDPLFTRAKELGTARKEES